ncbi:glycosyltransferase [Gordonia alkanivorans]|uniref:glycosyltransferase n=1 Tax=Gordonia alkanivorans TaxID=84096 RepID=UPI0024B6E7D1|nr:glycosyltransferase [Gordonia alkanivorans]MDJ0029632.1 glycosyltransferase [Gordonia alkanivorans]
MKIAHVITYISPDGAYGGPVRVAFGQAAELARRGCEVTVYAGSARRDRHDYRQDGYLVREFPANQISKRLGFAGMYARGLGRELRRDLRTTDVVHVHMARDLVTLPAAFVTMFSKTPFFVQSHGMIDSSTKLLSAPVDGLATRRLLRGAQAVLALTEREKFDLRSIEADCRVTEIVNGIELVETPSYTGREPAVLFMARLQQRKRPVSFVEMAGVLVRAGCEESFRIAGPDEGELDHVLREIRAQGLGERVRYVGPVDPSQTDRELRQASVFVLPAVDEVFPMTMLEAFRMGTPVVTTSSLGIARVCEEYGAAVITDGSPQGLADGVKAVLADEVCAESLRAGARRLLEERLSIAAVGDRLLEMYSSVTGTDARSEQ